MKVFLIVLALLFVCSSSSGAAPTPPKKSDTFFGSGSVVVETVVDGVIASGTFEVARSKKLQQGVENETFTEPPPINTYGALLHYDKNITYYIRGYYLDPHCFTEDRNFNSFPNYWEWLGKGLFGGTKKMSDGITYNVWTRQVSGIRFEYLDPVSSDKSNFYFVRKAPESFVTYHYTKYEEKEPDPAMFKVPNFCS